MHHYKETSGQLEIPDYWFIVEKICLVTNAMNHLLYNEFNKCSYVILGNNPSFVHHNYAKAIIDLSQLKLQNLC